MDESTQRYREIRSLLADLVATWPWDRPGAPFEAAKVYLDFHCVDCGRKLSVNDLAVVLELEMLRLGTVDARKVRYYDPICVRCYVVRAGLECSIPGPLRLAASTALTEAIPAARTGSDKVIHRSDSLDSYSMITADTVPIRHAAADALLPHAGMQIRANPEAPRQRFARYLSSWQADLLFGALMLVVLIVVLLLVSQPARHAVTPPPSLIPATMPAHHQGASLLFPIDRVAWATSNRPPSAPGYTELL